MSEEWTETGVQHLLIYIYDASGSPIGMAYRDSTYVSGDFDIYLFAKNIQGDILYIYNTSGTRLVTYTYDAWGKCYVTYQNGGASTSARYNPFRYRGYYYDTETGFYYLNSRYYDPAVGRFLNADGYINANGDILGFNMFAYCSNNPVMYADFNGDFIWTILAIVAIVTLSITLGSCDRSPHIIASSGVDEDLIEILVPGGHDEFEDALSDAVNQLTDYLSSGRESCGYIYQRSDDRFYFSSPSQKGATEISCIIDFSNAPSDAIIVATIHTHPAPREYGHLIYTAEEWRFATEFNCTLYVLDENGCLFALYPDSENYMDYKQVNGR